jgi:hypothetical protein
METFKKVSIAALLIFFQHSALACSYVRAIDVFYEKGAITLSRSENKKLQSWLESSLVEFPAISSISIEANAYASNIEEAKSLANTRGMLLKIELSTKLPSDVIFSSSFFGHTKIKIDELPTTDVVFIDIRPDVEKMKLSPCSPVIISP